MLLLLVYLEEFLVLLVYVFRDIDLLVSFGSGYLVIGSEWGLCGL